MDYERALVGMALFNESEMALSSECTDQCARKVLDTADIVREAIYRQSSRFFLYSGARFCQFAMTPERRKVVLAALNHRTMLTANDAARAISQDPDPALLPRLVWTLRHGRRTHNRVEAAYALGFMRGTEGTAALESALSNTSENTRVRAFAAETLAHRHRRGSHAGGTLGVGAVGAFDGAIEFGGAGQHEPVQTAL